MNERTEIKRRPRKALRASVRFLVLKRDGFRCRYCQAIDTPLHVDHIVPVAKGGSYELDNLITACERCNIGKGVQGVEVSAGEPVRAPQFAGIEVAGRIYDFDTLVSWRRFIFRETALTPQELVRACELSDPGRRAKFIVSCWMPQWNQPSFRKTKVWAMYGN